MNWYDISLGDNTNIFRGLTSCNAKGGPHILFIPTYNGNSIERGIKVLIGDQDPSMSHNGEPVCISHYHSGGPNPSMPSMIGQFFE